MAELVGLSVGIGADLRLVQGAGGNVSVKRDGVMWIKASGTRLLEAAQTPIFVPMSEAETREAVMVTEDLAPCIVDGLGGGALRPSIETSLHVLLPHRVVVHVHATGAIAAGLTARSAERIHDLGLDAVTVVVPYAKPGIELARAVFAELGDEVDATEPVVVLLRNHGLIVGAADADRARELVDAVEEALRTAPAPVRTLLASSVGSEEAAHLDDDGYRELYPAGTVGERAAAVLCRGALTPDSSVFLGRRPFARADSAERAASPCVIGADGSVRILSTLGADEVEIAESLVDVAVQVTGDEVTSFLSDDEVLALIDWEAEKWRQSLKR
ncbi:class II aldolase/adducin family protein [Herbiconiux sp. YIM B11900]|uniref:class II aldolase/adducin family protein n=1 Tax=Herbiconiux sp. YIM B11900 TaxID=3404131 RepID=UPI003F83D67E